MCRYCVDNYDWCKLSYVTTGIALVSFLKNKFNSESAVIKRGSDACRIISYPSRIEFQRFKLRMALLLPLIYFIIYVRFLRYYCLHQSSSQISSPNLPLNDGRLY